MHLQVTNWNDTRRINWLLTMIVSRLDIDKAAVEQRNINMPFFQCAHLSYINLAVKLGRNYNDRAATIIFTSKKSCEKISRENIYVEIINKIYRRRCRCLPWVDDVDVRVKRRKKREKFIPFENGQWNCIRSLQSTSSELRESLETCDRVRPSSSSSSYR